MSRNTDYEKESGRNSRTENTVTKVKRSVKGLSGVTKQHEESTNLSLNSL